MKSHEAILGVLLAGFLISMRRKATSNPTPTPPFTEAGSNTVVEIDNATLSGKRPQYK